MVYDEKVLRSMGKWNNDCINGSGWQLKNRRVKNVNLKVKNSWEIIFQTDEIVNLS